MHPTPRPPATGIWMADLRSNGELLLKAQYTYALLNEVPGASEIIAGFHRWLWSAPEQLTVQLPWGSGRLFFRWVASSPTTGIATIRSGDDLASLSLLAGGADSEADAFTLSAFQNHLLHELHGTPHEPAFDLQTLTERPLAATVNFHTPPDPRDPPIVALLDRCFAAAWLRRIGLI